MCTTGPRIFYLSDLHLEYLPDCLSDCLSKLLPEKTFKSDILILAGDIGSIFKPGLREFLKLARSKFNIVIYVPGNHEFWGVDNGVSAYDIHLRLQDLCTELDIVYLNRQLAIINQRIYILGTTLWSLIPESMDSVMTDYLRDNSQIINWSPANARQEFYDNYAWLEHC